MFFGFRVHGLGFKDYSLVLGFMVEGLAIFFGSGLKGFVGCRT